MSDTGLRDTLALERTRLANERTLLAYLRTALALVAAGAVVLHFFPDRTGLVAAAWVLTAGGVLALVVGSVRFVRVRRRL